MLNLYYGLDLCLLPLESVRGPSVADVIEYVPPTTGRPRKSPVRNIGARSARYFRDRALESLGAECQMDLRGDAFDLPAEPNPLKSDWYIENTRDWELPRKRNLILTALRHARLQSGFYPRLREEIWLEIDWWAYRNAPETFGRSIGRPIQRVNQQRTARANARMAIATWDLLARKQVSRTRRQGAGAENAEIGDTAPTIRSVSSELGELLLLSTEVELIHELTARLEGQISSGLSDQATALLLCELEDVARRDCDGPIYARAAAAISRAAADHRSLGSIAPPWVEHAIAINTDPIPLSEAALNSSVLLSTRRRYSESDTVLRRVAPMLTNDPRAESTIAIGASAWRRRLVSEALAGQPRVQFSTIEPYARDAIRFGQFAVEKLPADAPAAARLRAEVRLSEALAVTNALATEQFGRTRAHEVRDFALQAVERQHVRLTSVRDLNALTAYDEARLAVIHASRLAIDSSERMTEFSLLTRVRQIQESRGVHLRDPNEAIAGEGRRSGRSADT